MRSKSLLSVLLVASLVLVASCSDGGQYLDPKPTGSAMSQQQQYAELSNRPSLEEVVERYEEMRRTIRDRLTSRFGLPVWTEQNSPRSSGCAPQFPDVDSKDAGKKFLSRWFSTAPVTENWQEAKQIVVDVSRTYGFNSISLDIQRPDDAEFNVNDQNGAELSFGSAKNTVLALTTGCHLTAEAKQRIKP